MQNPLALRRLIAAGALLRPFPTDIIQESYKSANEMYADFSAKSPAFKTLYEHQLDFMKTNYSWWQISEFTYDGLMLQAIRNRW